MFKFNFKVDETDNLDISKEDVLADRNEEIEDEICNECKEIQLKYPIEKDLSAYKLNSRTLRIGDIGIDHVISGPVIRNHLLDDSIHDIREAESKQTDLIPGIYEGGSKIWECTEDLLDYLNKLNNGGYFKDKLLLDLGCGAGILGIYALLMGAVVHFQDYNEDVIEKITIPNILLNVENGDSRNMQNGKFYSGDWSKYKELTQHDNKFDLILTAETIYNPKNYRKLLDVLACKLKSTGLILLAAKRYYFGVGGSVREFENVLRKDDIFQSKTVWSSEIGVPREILEIRFKN